MSSDPLQKLCTLARNVIETEAQAVMALTQQIDQNFINACKLILQCQGRVVVTGLGKSGHIARKIAATFASTGAPAFFVHAGEASHGDLGMITS
ncbi:MAG: SIS domain-containing protein, partial [Methylococcales bacterium]|nr:SIS domain-containing protein [Methylococcales bacterium]